MTYNTAGGQIMFLPVTGHSHWHLGQAAFGLCMIVPELQLHVEVCTGPRCQVESSKTNALGHMSVSCTYKEGLIVTVELSDGIAKDKLNDFVSATTTSKVEYRIACLCRRNHIVLVCTTCVIFISLYLTGCLKRGSAPACSKCLITSI